MSHAKRNSAWAILRLDAHAVSISGLQWPLLAGKTDASHGLQRRVAVYFPSFKAKQRSTEPPKRPEEVLMTMRRSLDMQKCVLLAMALVAIGLAGCIGPFNHGDTSGTSTTVPDATKQNTADHRATSATVEVYGTIRNHTSGWLVDVQAYNAGNQTLAYVQSYCVGTAWYAQLSGPPGQNLTYRDPNAGQLLCPGFTDGRFEAESWQNWTADPSCDLYYVCDNQWDGRLWPGGETDSGLGQPAPPGNYTWRFIFPYFDRPGYVDGNESHHAHEGRHTEELVFTVKIEAR